MQTEWIYELRLPPNTPPKTLETYRRTMEKIGRNDPCPCGSKKKYKKCCEIVNSAAQQKAIQEENAEWEEWFKNDCEEGERNLLRYAAESKKYKD